MASSAPPSGWLLSPSQLRTLAPRGTADVARVAAPLSLPRRTSLSFITGAVRTDFGTVVFVVVFVDLALLSNGKTNTDNKAHQSSHPHHGDPYCPRRYIFLRLPLPVLSINSQAIMAFTLLRTKLQGTCIDTLRDKLQFLKATVATSASCSLYGSMGLLDANVIKCHAVVAI